MTSTAANNGARAPVFISYRRIDDAIPDGARKGAQGFVSHLFHDLQFELTQRGLAGPWLDRLKLEHADEFTEVIKEAVSNSDLFLAVVSKNYIQSEFCARELDTFIQRLGTLSEEERRRRIFRVDKHAVRDDELPPVLRDIHAAQFYLKDETGRDEPFFNGGAYRYPTKYKKAVWDLCYSIYRRLEELGMPQPEKPPPETKIRAVTPMQARLNVYVAKPATDMSNEYEIIVRELRNRGFGVVPDPNVDIPAEAARAVQVIRDALGSARLSIHLIGESAGTVPEGLEQGIVLLQLAEAWGQAERNREFTRLIWIPKRMRQAERENGVITRDPFEVLQNFGGYKDGSDEIESDTLSRFNEFVLHRLKKGTEPSVLPKKIPILVSSLPTDGSLGLSMARRLKDLGADPLMFSMEMEAEGREAREEKFLKRVEHVLFCWGQADEASVIEAVDSAAIQRWHASRLKSHVCIVCFPPASSFKSSVIALGSYGASDVIVDANSAELDARLNLLLVPGN